MSASQDIALWLEQLSDIFDKVRKLEANVASLHRACEASDRRAREAELQRDCAQVKLNRLGKWYAQHPGDASLSEVGSILAGLQVIEPESLDTDEPHVWGQDFVVQTPAEPKPSKPKSNNMQKASGQWQIYPAPSQKKESLEDKVKKWLGMPPYDGPANIVKNDRRFAEQLDNEYGAVEVDLMISKLRGC